MQKVSGELPPHNALHLFHLARDISPDIAPQNIIHMTAKDAMVGRTHFHELKSFIEKNPTYHFYFWNDDDINTFMTRYFSDHRIFEIFNDTPYGIIKADLFRLCVLYVYGGFILILNLSLRVIYRLWASTETPFIWSKKNIPPH